jgi:serine-type D-Ala-D-Ala carboxypeptidase (penicillin-binding protein 5/6)
METPQGRTPTGATQESEGTDAPNPAPVPAAAPEAIAVRQILPAPPAPDPGLAVTTSAATREATATEAGLGATLIATSAEPGRPTPLRRQSRAELQQSKRRRGPSKWLIAIVLLLVLAVGGTLFVIHRLSAPPPIATVEPTMSPVVRVPGSTPTIPWLPTGQSAVAIPALGVSEKSGPETPVPVASLTKMMTAYIIFHDRPIAIGQDGPGITIGPADVANYDTDTNSDQANVPVQVGEILTERQVLTGMLVHSANNLALTLAAWDAGSIPAFVAKMNATAKQLGMDQTHYADPSGYDVNSVSTASDLLKVAAADMTNPAFAQIVTMPTVTLPIAGVVTTYTPLLGYDGVVGVKSGFTTAAGGCDVMALQRQEAGRTYIVLAADTGQTGAVPLASAGIGALSLATAAASHVILAPTVVRGSAVAHVSVAGHSTPARAETSAGVLAWPGQIVRRVFSSAGEIHPGAPAGTPAGMVHSMVGTQNETVLARTQTTLPEETRLQRVF